jgi:hypothetical protein
MAPTERRSKKVEYHNKFLKVHYPKYDERRTFISKIVTSTCLFLALSAIVHLSRRVYSKKENGFSNSIHLSAFSTLLSAP